MSCKTAESTTHQGNLAKLPRALAPLIERPQWCVWRWTQQTNGRWQKPPYQARDPQRHASTKDPGTWSTYAAALDVVKAGLADGISYMLTPEDSFAAFDLDHCRHAGSGSIDAWAQNFLDETRNTYSEVTPSGEGIRIWGLTGDGTEPMNRKFTLEIDGKPIAAELFRRTPKALTITGNRITSVRELANVDRAFDWAITWGERRKAAAAEAEAATQQINGHAFNGGGGHDVDDIERIVREGVSDGANRSDTFHAAVGHYVGCGWSVERIDEHLRQFPDGIGGRYLGEGRLSREIARSVGKYQARALPLIDGWKALGAIVEAPAPKTPAGADELGEPPKPETPGPGDDPEPADDAPDEVPAQDPSVGRVAPVLPATPDPDDDPELVDDPELEDDEPEASELGEKPRQDPQLPRLYVDGDPEPDALASWLVKHLLPSCGVGLLSGQNGTFKTFVVLDLLLAAIATGQPFLGFMVKRQCGSLLIAAEGARQVRRRRDAVVREKCGGAERLPFRLYKQAPLLLHKNAAKDLIAMARQADASLQAEYGLPLGIVVIDNITACAGYTQSGGESDAATGSAIMGVLKAVAEALDCFVLGVAHLGKSVELGTRGTVAKEDLADVVWLCLGEKALNGRVTGSRLAIRKNRDGLQGEEYAFTARVVTAPEPDEDGEPITSRVIDWQPAGAPDSTRPGAARPAPDPWAECRRQDQRTAVLRLKRVLMDILADRGVDLPIPPDGPTVRMIDQEIVREQFYSRTPAEGTPKQKRQLRFLQFRRALGWAEDQQLIGVAEIGDVTYLRLSRPQDEGEDEPC